MMENWKTALDQWLQSPFLSQDEKNTLSSSSPETLSPTFQSALSFGTAGLRGIAALGPAESTALPSPRPPWPSATFSCPPKGKKFGKKESACAGTAA